jgi:hypothetical protein
VPKSSDWQLKMRMGLDLKDRVTALAKRRRLSISQLVKRLVERELAEEDDSGSVPDEQAAREMAILVAVEHCLKLQEASIPGGPTLSRRVLGESFEAAIARLELVDASLRRTP